MSLITHIEPISWRVAKHLFREKETSKDNIFDAEDWLNYYGLRLTEEQQETARSFPWNEEVLTSIDPFYWNKEGTKKEIRETHFAFFGLGRADLSGQTGDSSEVFQPLTLRQWEKLNPIYEGEVKTNLPKFYRNGGCNIDCHLRYNGENVVVDDNTYHSWFREENLDLNKHAPSLRWYLMPKEPRFFEIGATERVPRASDWLECLTALTGKSEAAIIELYAKHISGPVHSGSYPDPLDVALTAFSSREVKRIDKKVLDELLEENIYDIPFAVEEVMKVMLYHKKNNIILNRHASGGCRELSHGDDAILTANHYEQPNPLDRVSVGEGFGDVGDDGPCPYMGLDILRDWIVGRDGLQGLSLSRKPRR